MSTPSRDRPDLWPSYWSAQGEYWRKATTPLLDRQQQLIAALESGVAHPFAGQHLDRSDIEWLLHNLDQGLGPIFWDNRAQRHRLGLDLSGALLQGTNLQGLPLARTRFGLMHNEWEAASDIERREAIAHLEGANLRESHLEGAFFCEAHVELADFTRAHMQRADFYRAMLSGTCLLEANLRGTILVRADFSPNISGLAHEEPKELADSQERSSTFTDLRLAFLDESTGLASANFGSTSSLVRLADVRWGNVNLSTLDLTPFTKHGVLLGDEQFARMWRPKPYVESTVTKQLPRKQQLKARRHFAEEQRAENAGTWLTAARAQRQFATALRNQGMNDEADHFAYRAQICQLHVLRLQDQIGRAFFSSFLDLLAGFGYKPGRTLTAYLLVILGFAAAYWLLGPLTSHPFAPDGALVFSVTSFHGRGFFPGGLNLEDWITRLAALEAVVGLVIEISFIATFTQRFFGSK